jgi:hypothetical protein
MRNTSIPDCMQIMSLNDIRYVEISLGKYLIDLATKPYLSRAPIDVSSNLWTDFSSSKNNGTIHDAIATAGTFLMNNNKARGCEDCHS